MAAAVSASLLAAPATSGPTEYQVKAAFLYNFARYVQWPPAASPEPFVITVLGRDPFGAALDDTLRGKTVGDQPLEIRRAQDPAALSGSHIVFIGESHRDRLPEILARLEGTATLTVGEMDRFAERGGAVRFRMDGERVRLDINPEAARRARLKISSELLKLARIVGPGGGR